MIHFQIPTYAGSRIGFNTACGLNERDGHTVTAERATVDCTACRQSEPFNRPAPPRREYCASLPDFLTLQSACATPWPKATTTRPCC